MEAQQFSAAPVRDALAAQRELGEPFEHLLGPSGHPEASSREADHIHQLAENEEALVTRAGAHQRAGRSRAGLQRRRQSLEGARPIDRHQATVIPQHGNLEPFAGTPVHHQLAAVIAHPVGVHLRVRSRLRAQDPVLLRVQRDVAALRATRTDARTPIQIPGPRLEEEILVHQGTHRAHIHDVHRERMLE